MHICYRGFTAVCREMLDHTKETSMNNWKLISDEAKVHNTVQLRIEDDHGAYVALGYWDGRTSRWRYMDSDADLPADKHARVTHWQRLASADLSEEVPSGCNDQRKEISGYNQDLRREQIVQYMASHPEATLLEAVEKTQVPRESPSAHCTAWVKDYRAQNPEVDLKVALEVYRFLFPKK